MPHHFTKSTVQAPVWCNHCGKHTPWRIADGRQQYCLTCYERREQERDSAKQKRPAEQGKLF